MYDNDYEMASRKKRALPPWLCGVTVGKQSKPNAAISDSKVNPDRQPKTGHVSAGDKNRVETKDAESKDFVKHDEQQNGTVLYEDTVDTGADRNANSSAKPGGNFTICRSERDEKSGLIAEEIVALSYPEYKFRGSIVYSYIAEDCNILCDEILESIGTDQETVIGFDTEWPVTYQKNEQAKTALVQICLSEDKCYLFHVSCMVKFPIMLRKLIENQSIKKVGVNVEYDLWKLETDYDLRVKAVVQNSTIDLRKLANQKLKSSENWSLEGLPKNVLRMRLSKNPSIRTCDWSQYPLPEIQKQYAAGDAVVSLKLYKQLMKIQR